MSLLFFKDKPTGKRWASGQGLDRVRNKLRSSLLSLGTTAIEPLFVPLDRALMRRNRNLRHIPFFRNRKGGKLSYGEWCWLIGLLQTLIHELVAEIRAPKIVDLGCGTGLAMIAAQPSVVDGGEIVGLDVGLEDVEFCRKHYPNPPFSFEHLDAGNAVYSSPGQGRIAWPLSDNSVDLVTAVSVWTHLQQPDAVASLAEASRVLRIGGKVLMSAFLIADPSQPGNAVDESKYHRTAPSSWRFDTPLGNGWFSPKWATPPELAVGITLDAFRLLADDAGFEISRILRGTWTENPGLYFQDLIILNRIR